MECTTKSIVTMIIALATLIPILQSCLAESTLNDKLEQSRDYDGRCVREGLPGRDGRDGRDGLQGESGRPGLQGLQGIKGERGLKGERGQPGPVFKPQAVAFTVKTQNGTYLRASNQHRQIYFNVFMTNIGGDFQLDGSAFICRVPGLYFFAFNFISDAEIKTNCVIDIMRDEQLFVRGAVHGIYQTCSGQAVLLLKKKERVWLRLWKKTTIQPVKLENSFSGFLIREM